MSFLFALISFKNILILLGTSVDVEGLKATELGEAE
jgi:hypothetical protein